MPSSKKPSTSNRVNGIRAKITNSTNLEVPLESKDRGVKTLVCKFWELVQAMQKGNNISGEEPELARKFFTVEFFKDEWSAHVGRRLGASSFLLRKNVWIYSWLQRLMRNSSREEVSCVFTKKPGNLGHAFA